ncbi:MAG: YceI family protein, partial [Ferruginibacter sp.]
LKGPDFFDIENYKQITFTSNRFERAKIFGHYELYGELTMKGISKSIKMEVEFGGVVKDPWGNDKAGFSVNGSLNRKDWGLVWNTALETGGVVVGEEVKINCEIELLKAT